VVSISRNILYFNLLNSFFFETEVHILDVAALKTKFIGLRDLEIKHPGRHNVSPRQNFYMTNVFNDLR
jgi:hypothetical protein